MATIALVQFDAQANSRFTEFFRAQHHTVTVQVANQQSARSLHSALPDVVIVNVSSESNAIRRYVAELRDIRAERGPRPMVLFVSFVYRGARFELDWEHKGGRFVYVF